MAQNANANMEVEEDPPFEDAVEAQPGWFRRTLDYLFKKKPKGPPVLRPTVEEVAFENERRMHVAQMHAAIEESELQIKLFKTQKELEFVKDCHLEAALAHVNLATRGKEMDKNYETLVVRYLSQYFEQTGIVDPIAKLRIIENVIPRNIIYRTSIDNLPVLTRDPDTLHRVKYVNELNQGIRVTYPWWNFYMKHVEQISPENENGLCQPPKSYNVRQIIGTITIGSTIVLIGGYTIFKVCSAARDGITTHLLARLPPPPIPTGTLQNSLASTAQTLSNGAAGISVSTSTDPLLGNSTIWSTACGLARRKLITQLQSMITYVQDS